MARYRLKRKTYGIVDTAGNVVGGTVEGVGKAMDTKVGGLVGGVAGMSGLGSAIGSGLSGLGVINPIATPLGWIAGAALGSTATRGIGKGMKNLGQDMQS